MHFFIKRLFRIIIIALFTNQLIFNLAIAAQATSTVNIKATVVASCTFVAPETVTLADIPSSEFVNKVTGDYLNNYSKKFNLVSNCTGADKYKYTLTAIESDATCIKTNTNFMRYCLRFEDKYIDLSSGSFSIERANFQGDDITIIEVVPQVGATNIAPVGEVSGQITVKIEPI
ncbi:hypothetical protein J6836_22190 (plasmid) [Providencia sp. R33]|uniref:hypothetical protein n=1 Tax=Providencia sp. R33 TaxID=2828763 RepID=UPI001C5AF2D3|nr:hypothetical protein [Providencia sp. R33]QXX85196.1 hypothetical protein J6836_22190 [Providencia sp. R33]